MVTERNAKICALTFDDGPSNTTVEILDLLEKYGFTASFFVIGNRITAKEHRDIMKRAVKLGCTVENHSKTHGRLLDMNREELLEEFNYTQELVREIVGDYPQFFRAPGLSMNELMHEVIPLPFANGKGGSADWNSREDDPATSDLDTRVKGILDVAEDGHIFLLHDCGNNYLTPEALRIALPKLIEEGYRFVNIRELFRIKGVTPRAHSGFGWTRVDEV